MAYLGTDAPDHGPPDLRLVPAAAAVWAVTWILPTTSALLCLAVAGLCAVVACVAALGLRRPRPAVRAATGLLVLALAAAAAGATAVGARHAATGASPVTAAAEEQRHAETGVVVAGDPRPRAGPERFGEPQYVVEARTRWLDTGEGREATRVPVVIVAAGPQWESLVPSQELRVSGRFVPSGDSADFTAALLLARGGPAQISEAGPAHHAAGVARARLRGAAAVLPQPERGLVPALVVGDASMLPEETAEDFRVTSLTHVMVPSGAKLAIMLGVALGTARLLRLPTWAVVASGAGMIAVFVLVCRPEPSVLRAAAMGAIALLALALGRRRAAFSALAATVVGLLLFAPELARSYGFALSVLATGGLLVLAPGWYRSWRPWLGAALAQSCAVALAAQIAVYPLLAVLSAEVSLVAVPVNVLAAVMVPVATVAGFAVAALALVAPRAAEIAVWIPGGAAAWINALAEYGARLPYGAVPWPGGTAGALVLAALLGLAVWRGRRGRRLAVASVALLGALLGVQAVAPAWPPRGWALVACDVGQGDARVLAAGRGAAVVVDTGPDPMAIHRCLRELGVRRVELLVLTHDHADHVAGTAGVLRHREVRAALAPPGGDDGSQAPLLAQAGVPLHEAVPGQVFTVAGWRLAVLWPDPGPQPSVNDESVVLRGEHRPPDAQPWSVLLPGDVEEPSQRALMESAQVLDVDVLATPHHGAATQEPGFLAATQPLITITQVGEDNPHGHPHPDTWAELTSLTERNYRTDRHGDIAVVPTPEGLAVHHRPRQ